MTDAVYVLTDDFFKGDARLFGKDVANGSLLRALFRSGDGPLRFCVMNRGIEAGHIASRFGFDAKTAARIRIFHPNEMSLAREAGCVLHPMANIYHFAWQRPAADARAYSLCGLIHTLAPPATQEVLSRVLTAPTHPWDALVCTSRSVRTVMNDLLDAWGDHFKARFGGTTVPRVELPLIPLGVDCDAQEPTADRLAQGREWRRKLGMTDENDIAVLWMGRLSFFEKMHPFATFAALEEAAKRTSKRLWLILAGWFPADEHREQYSEMARRFCPSVKVAFLDGRQPAVRDNIWFAADIFTSLVDNIQETFGLAPVEAMASGLPGVVSDWDGYKDTVTHEEAGIRIPTRLPPPGSGHAVIQPHATHMDSYQKFAGSAAQATMVDISAAADAFARLAEDASLRRRMGAAARERARRVYDWPVIAGQYRALWSELAERRRTAAPSGQAPVNPAAMDPFTLFRGFATDTLTDDRRLALAEGAGPERLKAVRSIPMNIFARDIVGSEADCRAIIAHLAGKGPDTVEGILARVAPKDRDRYRLAVAWLVKMGLLVVEGSAGIVP